MLSKKTQTEKKSIPEERNDCYTGADTEIPLPEKHRKYRSRAEQGKGKIPDNLCGSES